MQLTPNDWGQPGEKNGNFTKTTQKWTQRLISPSHSHVQVQKSSLMGRNRDLRRGSQGHRLNEFGRCWHWPVGRQSAWQEESGAFTKKKKRTSPQRGVWIRKHLLFGQTQRRVPLESVEICSECCFERDRLYILSSIKVKDIWEMSSPASHHATETHTFDYNKDNLSITGSLLLLFTCNAKSSSFWNDGEVGQMWGSGPLLFSDGAL